MADDVKRRRRYHSPLRAEQADGTRQVVVVDEPRVFAPGEWQATVDGLVASGRFRLVARDGPLALLELTG